MRRADRARLRWHLGATGCLLAAGIGALAAGARAVLAMLGLMLGTLIAAGVADIGTRAGKRSCKAAVTGGKACREPAHLGAVHIECDTFGHHLDVVLPQAGTGAGIARQRAGLTRFDQGFVLLGMRGVLLSFGDPAAIVLLRGIRRRRIAR